MILYQKLEDIQPGEGTLDHMLITLPKCGHFFTVETLDGHCHINDFYTQRDGLWVGLQSPPQRSDSNELRKPPVCPTCRAVITSRRYGRVFKSADLHILEQNVITRMTQQLGKARTAADRISKETLEQAVKSQAQKLELPDRSRRQKIWAACANARAALLKQHVEFPVPPKAIHSDTQELFQIAPQAGDVWKKITLPLFTVYTSIVGIAKTRSAHAHAWEAAYSCLYEQEMNLAIQDPARAPRNPTEHATRMARMKVGQPQPRADRRFLVEAIWASLKIRFILADLALAWLKSLHNRGNSYPPAERQMWGIYGMFILETCKRDAEGAYAIAAESGSRRQMTVSSLLRLRADLESFRFNYEMARESGNLREDHARQRGLALEGASNVRESIAITRREHLSVLPDDGQTWFAENYEETADIILGEWSKLARPDTFYEPLSLDDKMAVIQALGFCE